LLKKLKYFISPTQEFSLFRRGRAFGQKVFRGEDMGEKAIDTAYKADWRLIPVEEEAALLSYNKPERLRPTVPKTVSLPPLLQHFVELDLIKTGQDPKYMPQLPIRFNAGTNNRAVYEGEDGTL
jgi:hypothetical protein